MYRSKGNEKYIYGLFSDTRLIVSVRVGNLEKCNVVHETNRWCLLVARNSSASGYLEVPT